MDCASTDSDSIEPLTEANKKRRVNATIREMRLDDMPAVFHLGEKLFTAEDVPNLYRTWDEYEVVSLFQTDGEYCLVADVDGEVVGFALGTIIDKRKSSWRYGYLIWLGVDPRFQDQGLAYRMFRQFHSLVSDAGARIIMVDTEADNYPALRFFTKCGFETFGEHVFLAMNIDGKRPVQKGNGKARNGRNGHRHGGAEIPRVRTSVADPPVSTKN